MQGLKLEVNSHLGLDARKHVFGVCKQQSRRPVSAFVIRFLEIIISKLATGFVCLI